MADQITVLDGVGFDFAPITNGMPSVADSYLSTALDAACAGGAATQSFFAALNDTASFWSMLAAGTIEFANAVDPQNEYVVIASSGNVDLRLVATYAGGEFTVSASEPPPVIGTLSVSLGIKGLNLTQMWAADIALTSLPAETPSMNADLFAGLKGSLYLSVEDTLKSMAQAIAQASTVVSPSVDPVSIAGSVLAAASAKLIGLVGAITRKVAFKYIQVTTTKLVLSYAAFGVLQAIPAVMKVLAHEMTSSILVYNLSDKAVVLDIEEIVHGKLSVEPSLTNLAGAQPLTNPAGRGDVVVDDSTNFQLTNSNQLGAIGAVAALSCPDWPLPVRALISVPWAGTNTIWLGTSNASADTIWSDNNAVNNLLTTTIDVADGVQATMAINALSGRTDGAYLYSVLLVIRPK